MPPAETFVIDILNSPTGQRKLAEELAEDQNGIHNEIIRRNGRYISSLVIDMPRSTGAMPTPHLFITADIPSEHTGNPVGHPER